MAEAAKSAKVQKIDTAERIKSILKKMGAIDDKVHPLRKEKLLHAIEIGHLLIKEKKQSKHGAFLSWLKDNVSLAERTAYNYMELAKNEKKIKIAKIANLTHAMNYIKKPEGKQPDYSTQVKRFITAFDTRAEKLNDIISEEKEIDDLELREKLRESAEQMKKVCERFLKDFPKKPTKKRIKLDD